MESVFQLVSVLLASVTSAGILVVMLLAPYMLVKPSFITIVVLNLTSQWSSAMNAKFIESSLKISHLDYLIIVQLFPLVGLVGSTMLLQRTTRETLGRMKEAAYSFRMPAMTIFFLLSCIAIVMAYYFSQISWQETGLYAVLFDPSKSELARESSLKLLQSQTLKYAYSFMTSTLCPLAAVLIAVDMYRRLREKRFAYLALLAILFTGILVSVSIYGGRSPAFVIIVTGVFALVITSQTRPSVATLFIMGLLALTIPAVLTQLREGFFDVALLPTYLMHILDRIFGKVFLDGVWHFQYVEDYGLFGLAGTGNFSKLFLIEPANVFNVVGLEYANTSITSVSANTTYLIAYYACFGTIPSFTLCFVLLLLLDLVLIAYRFVSGPLLIAGVTANIVAVQCLSSTFFTTALITYGFATVPMLCVLINQLETLLKKPSEVR